MRGGLSSFMQLQSNVGVAFVNALNINQALHWTRISWICMAIPGENIYTYISECEIKHNLSLLVSQPQFYFAYSIPL